MTLTLKVWMGIETYRGKNEYVFCGSINDGATYVFHLTVPNAKEAK